ncbi:MAG: hypothetical protein BWK75_02805 [Candidatus Altiarchaeales archaeon A3]|nr:MAG: hypothetical protein BWK75_02805 [Candidatus Altiarchaeales archaeon A3]
MNAKIFLVTLVIISIGIAICLFTIEQLVGIEKENYTQQKNYTSHELLEKNTYSYTQNSYINLTQTTHQQQNLLVNNISKNETYETIYKYILKEDDYGKISESNITIYAKEEWINGTKYVVAESKLDIPAELFEFRKSENLHLDFLLSKNYSKEYIKKDIAQHFKFKVDIFTNCPPQCEGIDESWSSLYNTIAYINPQIGNIKMIKIPYVKVFRNENFTLYEKLRHMPENKSEEEFQSNIIYSDESVDIAYEIYDINLQIGLYHLLYLIGFVKFEPENITITERTDLLDVKYSDFPFEGKESQTQQCGGIIIGDKPHTTYYVVRKYNVSCTKNTTKGIIADKQYHKEEFCSYETNLPKDEFEERMQESILKYNIITININFLGTDIFKGKEAYKIENKLKGKSPDALFERDTIIWIDKKDKIILRMNSTGELSGGSISAKYTTIYELINESIVKK